MTSHTAVLLLDLALIVALAQLLGAGARALGQPPVIGEVLAGVFVLPVLLHNGFGGMFPADIRADLTALANVGVALFMFIVGLELDPSLLRGRGRVAAAVSAGSVLLPLGLGTLLAFYLAGTHAHSHRFSFFVFVAVALSITAFPVLARILTDRGMQRTPVGSLALTSAAINDVLAWLLLAVAVAMSGHGGGGQWRVLLLLPYLAVMVWVVRPLLRRLPANDGELTLSMLATVLAGLLASAAATEWMGLHLIFGAFLFGVVMPRNGARGLLHDRVAELNSVLLLPVFFIVAGLKVDLSAFSMSGLGELALILLAAVTGKFLGAFTMARVCGQPARHSAVLGTLMNTRGLTELIVLSIGAELGLLDARLYTLMVVMALATTAMAGPVLAFLYPPRAVMADLIPPGEPARADASFIGR